MVYRDVLEFHQKFGFPIGDKPGIPGDGLIDFRIKLFEEEVKETIDAMRKDDIIEIADGIADCIYVLLGTAITYGINMEEVWRVIHASNMSKVKGEGNKAVKPEGWERPNLKEIIYK